MVGLNDGFLSVIQVPFGGFKQRLGREVDITGLKNFLKQNTSY
ncbi:hypothetical protein NSQ19_11540 [Weizmannia sp. FSL W8-1119]